MREKGARGACGPGPLLLREDGFTLAEQLFSILLAGLLGVVVAAGIGAALRTYAHVRDVADVQSALNLGVVAVTDELRYAADIRPVNAGAEGAEPASASNNGLDGGAYAFESAAQNARVRLVNLKDAQGLGSVGVQAIVPADARVSAGGLELVQGDAVPGFEGSSLRSIVKPAGDVDVTVQVASLAFDEAERVWTVELAAYKHAVWSDATIVDAACEARTGPLKVRALNAR